jgi:hypothetical protein
MGEYILSHELAGEQQRLALMSALLDPSCHDQYYAFSSFDAHDSLSTISYQ